MKNSKNQLCIISLKSILKLVLKISPVKGIKLSSQQPQHSYMCLAGPWEVSW